MSGYSSKPLIDKLGIRPGMKLAILGAPKGYKTLLGELPAFVQMAERGRGFDIVQYFVTSSGKLNFRLPILARMIKPDGMIWISWPKKSSRVETDLTEDVVRRLAIDHELVDIKVVAIDETWSGLKLVIPTVLRGKPRVGSVKTGEKKVIV